MQASTTAPTEPHALFRITPLRPIEELRAEALTAPPPPEAGPFRPPELVDLSMLHPSLRLDIRYAGPRNFLGTAFYSAPRAYLQRPAADALLRVHREVQAQGFGLIVYDAYRPWYVTKMFWEATPPAFRAFLADPASGSRHNRGCAVDVGLYSLETGREVEMPSGYDEFTPRAHVSYRGGPAHALRHRDLLRAVMMRHGFGVYDVEWWHFDFADWREYAILNVPFEALEEKPAALP